MSETAVRARPGTWGIVGGMGPLASVAFLQSIYEMTRIERDQDAPSVILDADSSCPDRTELLLSGRGHILTDHLEARLERLFALEVDRFVICCVTIHAVIDRISASLRARVESLVDIMAADVMERDEMQLVLCTEGARACRVLQSHWRWREIEPRLIFPSDSDQRKIHELLYGIKRGAPSGYPASYIEALLKKYSVQSFLACCTELHLLTRQYGWASDRGASVRCIDPLKTAAHLICTAGVGRLPT